MSLYPRLFENPDAIYDENENVITRFYHEENVPMPFGFYEGKLYITENGTHGRLAADNGLPLKNYDSAVRDLFKYSGRLWKRSLISGYILRRH